MWKRASYVLLIAACATCGTDESDDAPTPSTPCERLRDHLVELRMADVRGVDVEPHREAMKQSMGTSFLATCTKDFTSSQLGCAMASTDLVAAGQCMTAAKTNGGSR
ncbi:MAG: hypothetical protein ACKV2T_04335 [Kofleriaceae bacterium]